jgi:hypothetical protein
MKRYVLLADIEVEVETEEPEEALRAALRVLCDGRGKDVADFEIGLFVSDKREFPPEEAQG